MTIEPTAVGGAAMLKVTLPDGQTRTWLPANAVLAIRHAIDAQNERLIQTRTALEQARLAMRTAVACGASSAQAKAAIATRESQAAAIETGIADLRATLAQVREYAVQRAAARLHGESQASIEAALSTLPTIPEQA